MVPDWTGGGVALSFTEMGKQGGEGVWEKKFDEFSHIKSEIQSDIQVGSRIHESEFWETDNEHGGNH